MKKNLTLCLVMLMATLVLLTAQTTGIGKRVALVIGNAAYAGSPLSTPVNDAVDIADSLKRLGFAVVCKTNLSLRTMNEVLDDFYGRALNADLVVFYYSGHGAQAPGPLGNENYLLPIDISKSGGTPSETDIRYGGIPLGRITDSLIHSGVKAVVCLIDACRSFSINRQGKSITDGLATPRAPLGSAFLFATQEGAVARVGTDRNSTYTKALLSFLEVPGLSLGDLFAAVSTTVYDLSEGLQTPSMVTNIVGFIYLGISPQGSSLTSEAPAIISPHKPSIISDRIMATSTLIIGLTAGLDGTIYLSDSHGTLLAVDSTGQTLWSVNTKNVPNDLAIPVVVSNAVCLSGSKELVLVKPADGTVLSRIPLTQESSHIFGNRVVRMGDSIVVPGAESLVLLDAVGRQLKTIPVAGGTMATPAVWNRRLVVLTELGAVAIIDPATSAETARIETKAIQPLGAAPLVVGDTAYFSDRKGLVVCVDLNGGVRWSESVAVGRGIGSFTDLVSDGSGVFGLFKSSIIGLSTSTGKQLFAPIGGASTPPAVIPAGICFGTESGNLAIHSAKTGALIRLIPLGAKTVCRPLFIGNLIYVATTDGEVIVVNPEGE